MLALINRYQQPSTQLTCTKHRNVTSVASGSCLGETEMSSQLASYIQQVWEVKCNHKFVPDPAITSDHQRHGLLPSMPITQVN